MKKDIRIILLTLVCGLFAFGSLAAAQSTGSSVYTYLTQILDWVPTFWYKLGANISVNSISSTWIVFNSPIIRDDSNQDVKKYILWYGPYAFSQLLNGGSGISTSDFDLKEFNYTSFNWTTFTIPLSLVDWISSTQVYYATVIPVAANWSLWEMSWPDICFRIQWWLSAIWSDCTNLLSWSTHNSAGANMALANIGNTCNGNQITLTWESVPWADKVKIYKVLNNGQAWQLIVDKAMSIWTHVYTLPNPVAPEVVRFIPTTSNGTPSWTEKDYTLKLCNQTTTTPTTTTTTPTKPWVTKVPVVGPEQDIAYVLFLSLFVYGIVRYSRYRKAKH